MWDASFKHDQTAQMWNKRTVFSFQWDLCGACDPLCRVEDRNDSMLQKMRRYIKAFSKEDEKEMDGLDKTDTLKGPSSGTLNLRPKNTGGFNRRTLTGWQMIRHSALGLEMEPEDPEDDQDIKHV